MRKSKYINKQFDNGWTCTHVGVARTQSVFYKGTRTPCLRPYHQSYYYIFERETSDAKAEKLIRLNHREAAAVYRGDITVEEIAKARAEKQVSRFTSKISYHFTDGKSNKNKR